ncbi:hypothetical protein F5144DRAFT_208986 [Chaetomium tenue]|uniref:Uncharacterized protein n=1 Tax=Chaetomium tenue TaxID=1854479 RepID=A0ACB7PFU4_9PEZI|nr:hypothetical protein F5144DRAFT_208986 [Chaetomium globosum]
MSSNEKQPPIQPAGQQNQQQYFPPPPPGPPPAQTAQMHPQGTQPPKHTNETPLPDYNIPAYQPANPQFAAPPLDADDDLYNASPVNEQPPRWGHHQAQGSDGETKKKSHRLSAFGEAFTNKVAGPVNALANKFGSEGFLPEALDKECEKAARILRGFCKDGVYSDAVPPPALAPAATSTPTTADKPPPSPSGKAKKSRVLLTIPSKVIARAQGLAIFTAVRVGFQAAGSSGSGILVARLPDGSWSPPSGIQITSIGAGFVAGVDIYDCVIVINTREALEMFTKMRLSLGSDLAVTAGPFGAGGALDWGVPAGSDKKQPAKDADAKPNPTPNTAPPLSADNTHFQTGPVPENKQGMTEEEEDDSKGKGKGKASPFRDALKPVYSYVKSRGFYAGIQIDGTVIAARETANAKFYGRAVSVDKILKGDVPAAQTTQAAGLWPGGAKGLFEVLRGAEAGKPAQGGQPASAQGQPGLWQGHPQGGRPGSAGHRGPSPAFGAPAGTGGAPPGTWVPPPGAGAGAQGGVAGVTAGVRDLGVGASSASGPPPGTAPATSGAAAKAAEAAAEAARAPQDSAEAPPPSYSEPHSAADDLPPAYVEDERYRHVGGDSKTGLH